MPKYTKDDVGTKLKIKKINYKVAEKGAHEPNKRVYDDKIGRYKTVKGALIFDKHGVQKKVYGPEKVGPRYTDYHADSTGSSDNEDSRYIYRGYDEKHEQPLKHGFKFNKDAKDIPLMTELSRPNYTKGKRIHGTRSIKVAAKYALHEKGRNKDKGLLAKIRLDRKNDNFEDLTVPSVRKKYFKSENSGQIENAVKGNQQVVLNNEIGPDRIKKIYKVTKNPSSDKHKKIIKTRLFGKEEAAESEEEYKKKPTLLSLKGKKNLAYKSPHQPKKRAVKTTQVIPSAPRKGETTHVITPWVGNHSIKTPASLGFYPSGGQLYKKGELQSPNKGKYSKGGSTKLSSKGKLSPRESMEKEISD